MISVQAMLIGWFTICLIVAVIAEIIVKQQERQERQKSPHNRGNGQTGHLYLYSDNNTNNTKRGA